MIRGLLVIGVAVVVSSCGSSRCVTGQSLSCACVDGKMGAQTCMADGTFGACQCGVASCNASTCQGCCDATGACNTGQALNACGRSANLCVACGVGQSCVQGACVTATGGGGGGGTTGGGGGTGGSGCVGITCPTGGGGGGMCGSGSCESNGSCVQSLESRIGGLCGTAICSTCTTAQHCVAGACTPFKRVFATRTTYTGNLGGLTGADAKCNLAAAAAGLPGTYKAWLSDGTTDALSRITADGPWFSGRTSFGTPTTKRMFNNKANLQTLPLDNYLSWSDETGDDFEGYIWTGTATGGARTAETCSSWTATAGGGVTGRIGGTSGVSVWTQYNNPTSCSGMASLLCFEN